MDLINIAMVILSDTAVNLLRDESVRRIEREMDGFIGERVGLVRELWE